MGDWCIHSSRKVGVGGGAPGVLIHPGQWAQSGGWGLPGGHGDIQHYVQMWIAMGVHAHGHWVVWGWQVLWGWQVGSGDGHGIQAGIISPMSVVHVRG